MAAIATDNGKLAVMEWDLDWEPGLPLSPGTFGQDDLQQLLWGFPEILWGDLTAEPDRLSGQDAVYFGRFQQGSEISIVLQCGDVDDAVEDPSILPWVQVYRDDTTPELITSKQMPAEARRVEDGIFRLSLFLDTLYSTEGRYLVLMKWLDSNGVAHVRTGSFHLLPGGSPDGAVISMYSLIRQDATYLLMQCDSGRLIRKRNPR